MASSVLESSEEKIYGFKLMRLIVDGGTETLRNVFLNIHPGNLQNVLSVHHHTLYPLKIKKVITQPQWDKLYPHPPKISNIQEFDITLLVLLLRNICGLSHPSTGWNNLPSTTDNSREACIVRIKLFRNNFVGHVPETDISRLDFEARWVQVSTVLLALGLNQVEIDRLKSEECGEEEVDRVRKEWNEGDREVVIKLDSKLNKFEENLKEDRKLFHKSEKEIASKLDGLEKMLTKVHELSHESSKLIKSSSDDILSNSLHWCDFDKEIQLFLERYTKGTRKWVFQQVSTWVNEKQLDNRVFIISGQAGMGKSTIAAVICKIFPEHFGACHFFQYNNSRYNNPKFLLQSLAWQLSNVFPEYKKNLTRKLTGHKGKILDDMNIEGLFSMLFKEPFTNIPDSGKQFLIVIDALDEIRQEERYKFIDLITNHFHKFPGFVRFLITTRPENEIARKFQGLNPMFLKSDDERNLEDLRLFFEDKFTTAIVEHVTREELVKKLVGKSEGLMLYASFLCKLSEDSSIKSNVESLPEGIEEIYESYFSRLESELKKLGIDEERFLSLISVIAVAKQPLPLALIERLLSSGKDSLSAGRTLRKLISCLSSLLVIKDECVLFFHKSVKDWLVEPNHDFTIIETYGHETLADICTYEMKTLKQNEVSITYDLTFVYALQYGVPHLLQAEIKDKQSLAKLIEYVTDVEVVHASVCIDVYTTLSNLTSLTSWNMFNGLCEKTQETIKTLINIIRKFTYILKDIPHSFLQHVANEKIGELSPKASALLMTRYKGLAYFESEDVEETALIGRILTTDKVVNVDISPLEDFVICGYKNKGIELFSLSDFKPLWKVDDPVVEIIRKRGGVISRCIVFHPLINIIFPGQLDRVLNIEGKYESGPFKCENIPTKFTTCCFSHDKTKMVTNSDDHLTVWNLLDKKKMVSLSCDSGLYSISFSGNDRFLATTNLFHFTIYDSENNYSNMSFFCGKRHEVVISTFNMDSWYCRTRGKIYNIVKHDLTHENVSIHFKLLPLNARAAAEFQAVMESKSPMWFDKIGHGNFFVLSNGSALVSRYCDRELKIFRITELIPGSKLKHEYDKCWEKDPTFFAREETIISVDGRYIYTSGRYGDLNSYNMFSCTQPGKSRKLVQVKRSIIPFVPVTNGVFFVGELAKNLVEFVGGTPELWNSDVTERLLCFPELTGTFRCLSVAEDLVACIMESQVCFFDVLKKEIVGRTQLSESYHSSSMSRYIYSVGVIACSRQYHVLFRKGSSHALLLQDTKIIDSISNDITTASFSPSGRLLVFFSDDKLYILDIITLNKVCSDILLHTSHRSVTLEFVDEEHLLCKGKNCLYLINVKTCGILTCINVCMADQWEFSVCRKTGDIVVFDLECKKLKLIKLRLPN